MDTHDVALAEQAERAARHMTATETAANLTAERPVWEAVSLVAQESDRLHGLLNQLEGRLVPILGPIDHTAPPTSASPETDLLSGHIRMQSLVVGGAAERVAELLGRLEI